MRRHPAPSFSLLTASVGRRLALVALAASLLWVTIWWALH